MTKSPQQAINAFCRSCLYDEADTGSWRAQIERCTATKCPLFAFRPLTHATLEGKRTKLSGAEKDAFLRQMNGGRKPC